MVDRRHEEAIVALTSGKAHAQVLVDRGHTDVVDLLALLHSTLAMPHMLDIPQSELPHSTYDGKLPTREETKALLDDVAAYVADNYQGAKAETASTLYDFRASVDKYQLLANLRLFFFAE